MDSNASSFSSSSSRALSPTGSSNATERGAENVFANAKAFQLAQLFAFATNYLFAFATNYLFAFATNYLHVSELFAFSSVAWEKPIGLRDISITSSLSSFGAIAGRFMAAAPSAAAGFLLTDRPVDGGSLGLGAQSFVPPSTMNDAGKSVLNSTPRSGHTHLANLYQLKS